MKNVMYLQYTPHTHLRLRAEQRCMKKYKLSEVQINRSCPLYLL